MVFPDLEHSSSPSQNHFYIVQGFPAAPLLPPQNHICLLLPMHAHIHTFLHHAPSASLLQVREHVLGFGLVKDLSIASAYQKSAQGRENAERGIPGNLFRPPVVPTPTSKKTGAKWWTFFNSAMVISGLSG